MVLIDVVLNLAALGTQNQRVLWNVIYILTAGCFFPSQVEAWPRWATSGRLRGQNSTRFPTKLGQDFLPPDSTIFRNLFNFPAGPSPGTTSHHLEIDFA